MKYASTQSEKKRLDIPGCNYLKRIYTFIDASAGNNSRSSDIDRPNFENVRPISHYDRTR